LMFLRDISKQNGYNDQQIQSPQLPSAFRSTRQAQLSRLPALCQDYIQLYQQSAGPTQHQICALAPHEIVQSPPSCQRTPRTKDTRCLQDPLSAAGSTLGRKVNG
jgi:hypothetical protein